MAIIQGPPGSGKSYLCQEIQSMVNQHDVKVFSTDDYFMTPDGDYEYEAKYLEAYHLKNQQRAREAMDNHHQAIMIANTTSRNHEAYPYVRDGLAHGYDIWFVRCDGNYKNIHDVPSHKVDQIRARMEVLSVESCIHSGAPIDDQQYIAQDIPREDLLQAAHLLPGLLDAIGMGRFVAGVHKRKAGRKRDRNGGLHMTIIPPRHNLPPDEVAHLTSLVEQEPKPKLTGVGFSTREDTICFFFVAEPGDRIREWRAMHPLDSTETDYYPHVTMGFDDHDIHDIPKVKTTHSITPLLNPSP